MACKTHPNHEHQHNPSCGHIAVHHEGHIDYLHDSHLHHIHGEHIDEHTIAENANNQTACTPEHSCSSHDQTHQHGPGCGHESILHDKHVDFLVAGHLHHPCQNHCDYHGNIHSA